MTKPTDATGTAFAHEAGPSFHIGRTPRGRLLLRLLASAAVADEEERLLARVKRK